MVKIITYSVILIVILGLVYSIIKQFTGSGSGGGGKDIYLRKRNLLLDNCNQAYLNSVNNCNKDEACLKNASDEWNNCLNHQQAQ